MLHYHDKTDKSIQGGSIIAEDVRYIDTSIEVTQFTKSEQRSQQN